ncbi:MAG: hypothetical protein CVU65_18825 [Deltaproteobacteria bacterium HGW-Deltaproteobacteria-22]|jgi:alpha-tubulin suppressor-like RCC1 family protein|nr:MAG: hypothetical protein CVU65_18825 [Deltaproteobacteria bacterium HGW-Deltaproteobacteria-22]
MKHSILFSLLFSFWVFSGCSLLVEVKDPPGNPSCGDGQIDHDEDCDGVNLGNSTCETEGFSHGSISCATDCRLDTSECSNGNICGNSTLEAPEQCDGADLGTWTCEDFSFEGGVLACLSDCTFDTSGCDGNNPCGNGNIDTGEDCDGDNLNNTTCNDLGFLDGELGCFDDCRFDTQNCSSNCGNGVIDTGDGEDCEGSNLNNTTCADWGFDPAGNLQCNYLCRMDFSGCAYTAGHPQAEFIASGAAHSCGASPNGVFCWGWNQHGQLGTNSPQMYTPVPVMVYYNGTTVLGASSIAAGGMHTCVVATNPGLSGKIFCWGNNSLGQLGNSNTNTFFEPSEVNSTDTFSAVSAGFEHTCAIRSTDGSVWCWGSNSNGQLGVGGAGSNLPLQVPGLTNVTKISAGFAHTCAIETINAASQRLWCWGANFAGQLGLGDAQDRFAPALVMASSNLLSVTCGYQHTCAVDDNGSVYCWGANEEGQVGLPGTDRYFSPQQVPGISATIITAGAYHTCASQQGNNLMYCWGRNVHGQLGLSDTNPRNSPTSFVTAYNVSQISGGQEHTCATETDPTYNTFTYCWGGNWYGQLGAGSNYDIYWEEIVF